MRSYLWETHLIGSSTLDCVYGLSNTSASGGSKGTT